MLAILLHLLVGEVDNSTPCGEDRVGRKLKIARLAAGESLSGEDLRSRDEPFIRSFRERLASLGFQDSDQGEPYFTNEKNVKVYHLLFFSKDPAGLTLWRGIRHIEPSGQRTLPL